MQFAELADSYQYNYIDSYDYADFNKSETAGEATYETKAEIRGRLALQEMQSLYPTVDFAKAIELYETESVLIEDNFLRFGLDMNWWLTKWYDEHQMRYLIRTAIKNMGEQKTAEMLTIADVSEEEYANMSEEEFAVLYAEALLYDVEDARNPEATVPQGLPEADLNDGATLLAIQELSGTELELAGLDIAFVVQEIGIDYEEFLTFYAKLEEFVGDYLIDTEGVLTLDTTFPYADIGYTVTTAADVDVRELLLDLVDFTIYDYWYAGYQKSSDNWRDLPLKISVAVAESYGLTAAEISSMDLNNEDQERLVGRAHAICTEVGDGTFNDKYMLIHEYANTTSATKTLAQARAATQPDNKTRACMKIALNMDRFPTEKRLSDYGLSLAWYASHWWNDVDMTVTLIYAEW